MTNLRMGSANRVTAERFHLIKGALAEHMPDEQVMSKYQIKKTTLQYIKKSKTFYEYRLRTEAIPSARRMPKVVEYSSGVAYEDYDYRKRLCKDKRDLERQMKRDDSHVLQMLGAVMFGVFTMFIIVVLIAVILTVKG